MGLMERQAEQTSARWRTRADDLRLRLLLLPPALARYPEGLAVDHRRRNVVLIADGVGVDVARVIRGLFPGHDVKLHCLAFRLDIRWGIYRRATPIAGLCIPLS